MKQLSAAPATAAMEAAHWQMIDALSWRGVDVTNAGGKDKDEYIDTQT